LAHGLLLGEEDEDEATGREAAGGSGG